MMGLRSIRMSLGVTLCDAKTKREACRPPSWGPSSLLNRLHRAWLSCSEYARRFWRVRLSSWRLKTCERPQWCSGPPWSEEMSMDHEVPPVLGMC